MVFSSNVFLLYFLPLFLICYFVCPKKFRNYVILLFSIVFYAYGAPDFILYLLGSTVASFYLVKAMRKTGKPGLKKTLLRPGHHYQSRAFGILQICQLPD